MNKTYIDRPNFLQILGFLALMTVSIGKLYAAPADQRPNIVFILTDDQRYDAMGCAGNKLIHTPHIDSLAARGTRFDRAFVTLSICSPSRAAVLTGMYGSANGVTTLGRPIKKGVKTFADILKHTGYQTGFAGKWHLGTSPAQCGFDFISSFEKNGTYYNRLVNERGVSKHYPGFIDDFVADESIKFMETATQKKAPFVLWMCTQLPHMDHTNDWNARNETLAMYDQKEMPIPETWQNDLSGKPPYLLAGRNRGQAQKMYGYNKKEGIQRHLHRYYATITEVDAAIGRVIEAVDKLGLGENTWFVFMGDNGWFIGEHGLTSKILPYEESIRVPMIIAGPGTKAQVNKNLVLNIDLTATILDIAGVATPENMHGRSLLPLLNSKSTNWRESFLYEAPTPIWWAGIPPLMAVRSERWKFIQTYDEKDRSKLTFEELYDMEKDPHEITNLAPDKAYTEILAELRDTMKQHRLSLKGTN